MQLTIDQKFDPESLEQFAQKVSKFLYMKVTVKSSDHEAARFAVDCNGHELIMALPNENNDAFDYNPDHFAWDVIDTLRGL